MSLLTSADQRCLFCTGSRARYSLTAGSSGDGREGPATDRDTLEILWSQCIECGFSVPTSTADPELLFGDRERVERSIEQGRAVLVLPPEAAIQFHPARPFQIVRACHEAGFREVRLELLGDELVAERYLEHWRGSERNETWIRSTSNLVVQYLMLRFPDLLDRLVPVVAPPEAAARQLRATADDGTEVVYPSLGPPARAVPSSYIPFTLPGLAELLADRGTDPAEMPDEPSGDTMLRRRHLSVPGGLPREMLYEQRASSSRFHRVRDLDGLTEIARALSAGEDGFGFVDALPFESPLCHPALAGVEPVDLVRRRRLATEVEKPRADRPVVDPADGLDLSADFSVGREPGVLQVEDTAIRLAQTDVRLNDLTDGRQTLSTCPYRMEDRYQDALEDTFHDPITGVLSHEAFRKRFEEEVARAIRHGTRIGALLIALDSHDEILETYGREAGASLVQVMGDTIKSSVRETDVIGRIDRDRMGVILIDPTPEGLIQVAEKAGRRLAKNEFVHAGERIDQASASIGIAYHSGRTRGALTAADLFAEADASLYIAKAQGGNRTHPSTSEELNSHES